MSVIEPLSVELQEMLGVAPVELIPLQGATSSQIFEVRSGENRWIIRRFIPERWEISAPKLSAREEHILQTLTNGGLLAPECIGTLTDNGVLMQKVPGHVYLPKRPEPYWISELAARLVAIHASPLKLPYRYTSWNDQVGRPAPDWWADLPLWQSAQVVLRRMPQEDWRLIHRDYHPVNVLWEGRRISGVVDWINACMGPVGVDVAHCRLNLALMYGMDAADAFLNAYRRGQPQYAHHPRWDVEEALSTLPDLKPYPPWAQFGLGSLTTADVRGRLVIFVEKAVERLASS
ncbi:MAG: aminoglycoside phosphotransferase family protein [Pseudomonadales bacterium]|nr:aminoglycoside phosphotransferase family protein [Pseudomonadales bacterium]